MTLYQDYWISFRTHYLFSINGPYFWRLICNQQNQPFEQKSAFWWVCSTMLNKCGHTCIVSYYHNNSLYGTHTKTQKRIPLSLKHNFPTHNVTKLFHKSFLKSCVSMISENFYSKNLGILEYFRKENSFGFKYSNAISSYGTIPTGDVVNIDRYQKCYFSPLFHFAAIYIST